MNQKTNSVFEESAKPTKATLTLADHILEHARGRAVDRCIHIENDVARARAIRGTLPEEGASFALELASEWIEKNFPEASERFRREFTK